MKIAVVGATGLVGNVMVRVLEEQNIPVEELIPVATEKSKGKVIIFRGKEFQVTGMHEAVAMKPDIALFSAGGQTSKEWAPEFAKAGTTVIDNSSAWRMDPAVRLVVPEINAYLLTAKDKIIANPNCSTIQMVMVLYPLHVKYKIRRIVVSTYQSVTGTGIKAVRQMENERKGISGEMAYPYPIDKNCLPHIDVFTENGYTREEMKMVNETRKIINDFSIVVSPTAVRVPTTGGHSESVNVEFDTEFELNDVRNILINTPGIEVMDDIAKNIYPMPLISEGKDHVFVGRIRRDISIPKALNLWIVADNLRKGAATNAVQIARYLIDNKLI